MKEAKKTFSYIIAAFLLLCLVSLYRQISIHYFPGDPFRPFLTYGTYVFLIASWTRSLHGRITQKTMLTCLSVETFVLFLWLTVRLFQDTLLYKNTHIMRVSGYLIVFPLVFVTLMGLYFGLKLFGPLGMFIVPIAVMTLKAFNDTGRIHLWTPPERK